MNIWSIKLGVTAIIITTIATLLFATEEEPWRVKGKVGGAIQFSNVGDRIISKVTKEIDVSKGMTVGLWVKGDFWEEGRLSSFLYKRGSFGVHKRSKSNGGIYFWGTIAWRNTPLVWPVDKFILKPGKWYHLAMTYDPKTAIAEGYFNGKKVATHKVLLPHNGAKGSEIMNQDYPLILGYGRRQFFGTLDSVYIYDRALKSNEIKLLLDEQGPDDALVAYLFNEEKGQKIVDSSKHGHDAFYTDFSKMPKLGKKVMVNVLNENGLFTTWNQDASKKVMLDDIPVAITKGPAVCAKAAQNEYESFQIVLSPKKELSDVKFSISALKQINGSGIIPLNDIQLNQVAYAGITIGSQTHTRGQAIFGEAAVPWQQTYPAGMYPDALPANKPIKTAMPDRNYTLWVTVKVPPKTPMGIYEGKIKITTKAENREIPFQFKVWDFCLPEDLSSHNHGAFLYGTGWNAEANKSKDFSENEINNIYRNFARHHITIHPLYHDPIVEFDDLGNLTEFETTQYDKDFQKAFALGMRDFFFPLVDNSTVPHAGKLPVKKWQGIPMSDGKGGLSAKFQTAFVSYIKRMCSHLKEKGIFKYFTINNMDEPHTAEDFKICHLFAKIYRSADPELKVFLTKWPFKDLYGAGNIWCLGAFQPKEIKKALTRGESIRWYPNWHVLIDRPLMDSRIMGWIEQKYHLSGLYIWMTNSSFWLKSDRLYIKPFIYPSGRTIWGNGMLIYPNSQGHVINSIRWEMIRDTIEDFEYCQMLKALCTQLEKSRNHIDKVKQIRSKLKKFTDRLVESYESNNIEGDKASWKKVKYETDDNVLHEARCWVAKEIVKLKKLVK